MLAELMRFKSCVAIAGTHGKTTTTSLVATLLDAGGLDPTVINGGIINAYGTNARMGDGHWMVVEADESDGTFLKLPADVAVVTNIDPEHLDHFKTFDAIKDAFRSFIESIPFYGFAVMCIDHPTVQDLVGRIEDRRIITYGENPQADVRLMDVDLRGGRSRFSVLIRDRKQGDVEIRDLMMPMPGHHNALNATAAIAVAHELGVTADPIRKALSGFGGVKRRFTKTGEWNGVSIFDDYGHHPVEIAAVLKAARASTEGQVVAVVQPHRYTRLSSLFNDFCTCFNDADAVIVAPVYAAGEQPIPGADRDGLVEGLKARGHRNVMALERSEDLAGLVKGIAQRGRLRGLPRRRQHHAMGLCASGRARVARREGGVMFPDITADLRAAPAGPARPARGECSDGAAVVVPHRRSRAGALHAGRRRGPGLFPRAPRSRGAGPGRGARIEPARPRRRPRGVLVRLGKPFTDISVEPPHRVRAGAGAPDVKVARAAAEAGIAGLSFLRGIPGTVGGALRMNGGAYGGETKDVLVAATGITRAGETVTYSNAEMGFTYRHSSVPDDVIFTEAVFEGRPGDPAAILAEMNAITEARSSTQPVNTRTGGSTFKNPPGHKAWKLIDAAGCRGLRRGDAQVSEMHCNFLINHGKAKAADIEGLGEEVRRRVREASGVELEWEIKRVGIA